MPLSSAFGVNGEYGDAAVRSRKPIAAGPSGSSGDGRLGPATLVAGDAAPHRSGMGERRGRATALGQGAFWLATGLWPLAHYDSFEAVTGPKEDDWLVKTIGGLIAIVGGTLLAAGWRGRVTREIALLGAASATALAWADVYFVAKGRISKVYLLDALAEAPFLAGWTAFALRARRERRVAAGAPARAAKFSGTSAAAVL
jgi:hypothetical protein